MDLKDSLRDYIYAQCIETKCTDVEVSNIRPLSEHMYAVDLSYTWFLGDQEHRVNNDSEIFLYKEGYWYSSLFLPSSIPDTFSSN